MPTIPLTKNQFTTVDEADLQELLKFRWHANESGYGRMYAARREHGTRRMIWMHRQIMRPKDVEVVDHINGDGLDNRRSNLRSCAMAENNRNVSINRKNTSGYKGVSWHRGIGKWQALIKVSRKRISLGYFDDPGEAYAAYCEAAKKYHGEFAKL